MSDELVRWAAERAPELVARAEAEVVAELKRALLAAARGGRPAPPPATEPARAAPPAAPAADEGTALWAYCVARGGAPAVEAPGVDGSGAVTAIEHGDLRLLVSPVARAEFGEGPLREHLNDFAWLERVARAHETVLEHALAAATIVPLRLCTIFGDEAGARRMLDEQARALHAALDRLDGREEWVAKVVVDRDALQAAAAADAGDDAVDPGAPGTGAAYMLRRRRDRELRERAEELAAALADAVHDRLRELACEAVVNAPQNPELSGHEGDMVLNAAYLVAAGDVPRLRPAVQELRESHRALRARIELSGPFPPYTFAGGEA